MHSPWQTELMYLKKVGPKRAEILRDEVRLQTFADLLLYYPRKYVDRSQVSKIREIQPDSQSITLVGRITHVKLNDSRKGRRILSANFSDGTGVMELTWFQGVKWIHKTLQVGQEMAVFGRPNRYNGQWQITHPEMDVLSGEGGARHTMQIVPFYPSTEKLSRFGLDSRGFRNLMAQLFEVVGNQIEETLSPRLMQACQLVPRAIALRNLHFPESFQDLEAARKRLIFEEFFFFQLMLARRRQKSRVTQQAAPFKKVGQHFLEFFEQHMPFELTGAQKRVLKEIRKDLGRPVQMNRLIQGDVGSGKTMVAFMTTLIAKDNGFQTALMAPTAILADQHFQKLTKMAEKVGMTTALLVGGQRKKQRTEILERIASGEVAQTPNPK
ncbi:MAG: DEAD/DEAH box helicase, partial [Bacteroidota bacterium]